MSSRPEDPPAPEHEVLLAEILSGEVDLDDARAARHLAQCAACRAALSETRALMQDVVRLSREHRRDVAEALAARAPRADRSEFHRRALRALREDAPPVSTVHRARASGAPARSRARLWTARLVHAIAAALLVATALWLHSGDTGPGRDPGAAPGPISLGDAAVLIRGLTPSGQVAAFERFEWQCARQPGWMFEVVVLDAGDPTREIHRSPRTPALHWAPPASESASWPHAIRWMVEIRAPGQGSIAASEPLAASRSR